MLSWLEDDDCATIQACGLTSYMQLQQANAFILKILERDVLLPYPTGTEQDTVILKWQLSTMRSGLCGGKKSQWLVLIGLS